MDTSNPASKRFAVAVSFPSQYRQFVRNVVNRLAEKLGNDRIFFDEWYESELVGLDGDLKLRKYYREHSEIVVPFFSEHYEKPWCQIEWSAIRAMLKERRSNDAVVPVEMDGTKIEGWESNDIAIRRNGRTGKQIADLIHQVYHRRFGVSIKHTKISSSDTDECGKPSNEDEGASSVKEVYNGGRSESGQGGDTGDLPQSVERLCRLHKRPDRIDRSRDESIAGRLTALLVNNERQTLV